MPNKVHDEAGGGDGDSLPREFPWSFYARALLTLEWMQLGDSRKEGVEQQLWSEMSQVGLLSALLLTMIGSFIMLFNDDKGSENWTTGVSLVIWTASIALMAVSTLLCVFFLLAANECEDDEEASELLTCLGKLTLIPAHCFMASYALALGGCFFWLWIMLEDYPLYFFAAGGSIVLASSMGFVVYMYLVYCVMRVKKGRSRKVRVSQKLEARTPAKDRVYTLAPSRHSMRTAA